MKKKALKQEKHRCGHLFQKWSNALLLDAWQLEIDYYDGRLPGDPSPQGYSTRMDVDVQWEYKRAHIRVNCEQTQWLSWAELEKIVVHEICHILVAGMRKKHQSKEDWRQEERVVTELTTGVLRATFKGMTEWHPWPE